MAIAPLDSNYYHQFNLSIISARRRLCRPSDLTAARIFGITCTKELVASLVLFSTLDAVQRRPYCQPSRKLRIKYKIQRRNDMHRSWRVPQTRQKRVHMPSVPLRLGCFATRSTAFTVMTLDYMFFTGTVDGHGCLNWAICKLQLSKG